MAGMERGEIEVMQVLSCFFDPVPVRRQQVETPNDINDPRLATGLLCIFHDITDPGMGTPGNDDEAFVSAARECRIVGYPVGFGLPVRQDHRALSRIRFFKMVPPRDLAEENEIRRKPPGERGHFHVEIRREISLGYTGPDIRHGWFWPGIKAMGVGDEHGFPDLLSLDCRPRHMPGKRDESASVVEMSVRKHDSINIEEIDTHQHGIFEKQAGVTGVKK